MEQNGEKNAERKCRRMGEGDKTSDTKQKENRKTQARLQRGETYEAEAPRSYNKVADNDIDKPASALSKPALVGGENQTILPTSSYVQQRELTTPNNSTLERFLARHHPNKTNKTRQNTTSPIPLRPSLTARYLSTPDT